MVTAKYSCLLMVDKSLELNVLYLQVDRHVIDMLISIKTSLRNSQ